MQKGSRSSLSSISSQTLALPPYNNYLVDLWPNLWCNNYKATFFLDGNFFDFDISFISPQNACFLCELCGNVTTYFSLAHNYTIKNPLWNIQVCPKWINVIFENNMLHKSGAKSTFCIVVMKVSPLSLHILICTCPFCFAVKGCPSAKFNMFIRIL